MVFLSLFTVGSHGTSNDVPPQIYNLPPHKTYATMGVPYEWLLKSSSPSFNNFTVTYNVYKLNGPTRQELSSNGDSWLSIDSNGTLTGTPAYSDRFYDITITATGDGLSHSISHPRFFILQNTAMPTPTAIEYSLNEGGLLSVSIPTSSLDYWHDITKQPLHGTPKLDRDNGIFTYQHDGSDSTIDTIRFTTSHENLDSFASVTFNILAVNDPPIVTNVFYAISSSHKTHIRITPNATDSDSNTITFNELEAVSGFSLSPNKDAFIFLLPDLSSSLYKLPFQANDNHNGQSITRNIYILVDPPPTHTSRISVNEDSLPNSGSVLFNLASSISHSFENPIYSIASGNSSEHFTLTTEGGLMLNKPLDYADKKLYHLDLLVGPGDHTSEDEPDTKLLQLTVSVNSVVKTKTQLTENTSEDITITENLDDLSGEVNKKTTTLTVDAPSKIVKLKNKLKLLLSGFVLGRIDATKKTTVEISDATIESNTFRINNGYLTQNSGSVEIENTLTIGADDNNTSSYTLNQGLLMAKTLNVRAKASFVFNGGIMKIGTINSKESPLQTPLVNNGGEFRIGYRTEASVTPEETFFSTNAMIPFNLSDTLKELTSIFGDYTQIDGSVTFELTETGTTGKLVIDGTADLQNGALVVSSTTSLTYTLNQVFDLIDATEIKGSFYSVSLPELTTDKAWDTSSLYTNGTIKVMDAKHVTINSVIAHVYPNPVLLSNGNTEVYYKLVDNHNATLELYNMFGKKLYSKAYSHSTNGGKAGDNLVTIESEVIKKLSIGPYFILVHNGATPLAKGKFVVK